MKNQYVGDIGDFGKVLLLKHLAGLGFKVGVNWVLTENDDRQDGKHRDYPWFGIRHRANNPLYPLRLRPDDRRDCLSCCTDEKILQEIAHCAIKPRDERKIQHLERVLIQALPDKPAFYRAIYRDGDDREAENKSALCELKDANLVYFDPDNGIKCQMQQLVKSPKHIYIDELFAYWENCKSLLVYHHWSRPAGGNLPIIQGIQSNLENQLQGSTVLQCTFRRGSTRSYFLVLHPEHLGRIPTGNMEDVKTIRPLTFTMEKWRQKANPCYTEHRWLFN